MDFFWLLFAHFLADLPLQGEWVCKEKGNEPLFMVGHCVIWTGIIVLALLTLGIFSFWKLPFLFIGHYIMDTLKCRMVDRIKNKHPIYPDEYGAILNQEREKELTKWVYGDQLFHVGQLLCVLVF